MKLTIGVLTVLLAGVCLAVDIDDKRARFNYQMFCQGCHTPDGVGGNGVPRLKGHVGYFMRSDEGKAFLVRVPGAANSVLDNEQLAEVMNWMLLQFAEDSLPENWQHYTPGQVGQYRQQPLMEIIKYRQSLMQSVLSK